MNLNKLHNDIHEGALQLIAEHRVQLFAKARALCGNDTDADELVIRTIDRAIRKIDTYSGESDILSWMMSILVHIHSHDTRSPVVRGTACVDDGSLELLAGADWATDEEILKNSDGEAVRAALRELDPEYRQIVLLRFYEDLSLKEIAAFLNKPIGTVGRRIHVALHLLAGKLDAKMGRTKKPLAVFAALALALGTLYGAWVSPLGDWLRGEDAAEAQVAEPAQATETGAAPREDLQTTTKGESEMKASTAFKGMAAAGLMTTAQVASGASAPAPVPSPEPGIYSSGSYAQPDHLVAFWDAIDNTGVGQGDRSATTWTDLSGNSFDWTLVANRYEWTERGLKLKGSGWLCEAAATTALDNKVTTIEFVYANAEKRSGFIFSAGLNDGTFLYTDTAGRVGFWGQWGTTSVGSTVALNGTNCYSVVYTRTGKTPTGVNNFKVNGVTGTAEAMANNWYGQPTPRLGGRDKEQMASKGELFAIRIYDVALSDAEREQNRQADVVRYLLGVKPIEPVLEDGFVNVTLPASSASRTVVLCSGGTYAGTDAWATESTLVLAAGETTASFPKPAGWGTTVWYARAKVVDGGVTYWTKTIVAEPPAPLGMDATLTLGSSAFGSSEVSAHVTSIGLSATSATLTFHYGTTSNALDGTVTKVLDSEGVVRVTIPHLKSGTAYYVWAKLDNGEESPVTSDVLDFVQPAVAESGVLASDAYAQPDHLVAFWDAIDNTGVGQGDRSATTWTDLSGNSFDWTLVANRYEWTERSLRLKGSGKVGSLAQKTADFENKVSTIEFVYANKKSGDGIIFSPGFADSTYLYTDTKGRVGFYGPYSGTRVGTTVELNETNCYSVIYTRTGARPTGVDNFKVNGVAAEKETMASGWYGMADPIMGDRSDFNISAKGELFAIRIYDIALSDAERAQNWQMDMARYLLGIKPTVLVLQDGRFEATLSASSASRTVVLCSGGTYAGTDAWATESEPLVLAAGETVASFPKPAGWGSSVWYARVKIVEGDFTYWSKTLVAEPPAPLGMDAALTLGSSAFGSSDIAAQVTGIGTTATSATLAFHYGTASNALDGTVKVAVTDAGEWRGTLPRLVAGRTYYVQATLSNDVAEVVTSAVFEFEQPEVAEPGVDPRASLRFENGRFVVSTPASVPRTVVLCADESYCGTNEWSVVSEEATIREDETTASFPKPAGWGRSVWYARAKVVEGDVTYWTKTIMAEPPAPIGMDATLSLVSSAFGSAVVAANVTGIGVTASEATLTFAYGTTGDVSDGTVVVSGVDDSGSWSVTLPHLQNGMRYYVQATLSNDVAEVITGAVFPFLQPAVVEPGIHSSDSYAQPDHLVAFWDGLDNAGAGQSDRSAAKWRDLTGHGFDWTLAANRCEWTERALRLKGSGLVGTMADKVATDFENKVTTIEFVYANKAATGGNGGIVFSPGFELNAYLYVDPTGRVGFWGPTGGSVGTLVEKDATNCFSVVYTRTGARPTGVDNFKVNGAATESETMSKYWFNLTTPLLGARGDGAVAANGELFAIRIYDVALSDAEREQNRQTDVARYFHGVNGELPLAFRDGTFTATVSASDADQTVSFCWGEAYGGTTGWTSTANVVVPAGETAASFGQPEGWGESVFFVRARLGDGETARWSKTVVWQDPNVPAVSLGELDGVGGDTLVVKGAVDSVGAGPCTLTVSTGASEDALTNRWTNLDGATVQAAGEFELTLFEPETAAARYFCPGEAYFVRVEAKDANGKTAWSGVKRVTMTNAATFWEQSAKVTSKRAMQVTASMEDLGMAGKTTVELWVGESASSLAKTDSRVVTAVNENFTLTCELPGYETPYVWRLRAVNESVGETASAAAESATEDITANDKATYTWTGAGGDRKWSNRDNWTDNMGGDCLGYPQSASATATIGKSATIDVDVKVTIAELNYGGARGLDITLVAANATDCGLTGNLLAPSASSHVTLDGLTFVMNGGAWTATPNSTFELKNGANFTMGSGIYFYSSADAKATLLLSGKSTMSVGWLYMSMHAFVEIDDSTLTQTGSYSVQLAFNEPGDTFMRFKGAAPKLVTSQEFRVNKAGYGVTIDFEIPVGGWAEAPIVADKGFNKTGVDTLTVRVSDESAAARVDETVENMPLVQATAGVCKTNVVTVGLTDPMELSTFIWGDASDTPPSLGVTIVGSAHTNRLTVAGAPENVEVEIGPGYGHCDGGTPLELTAPAGAVEFAGGTRRATCAGWKLYDVDPMTRAETASRSGTGKAYAWTSPGNWQKFVWQWAIEDKVTVGEVEGVTVEGATRWVPQGGSVAIPVACDESVCIAAVEGGVYADGAIVVSDVTGPVAVTITPGAAWYVKPDGNDENNGKTLATAFATVKAALDAAAPGDEIRVAAGEYAPTETIVVTQAVTVVGAGWSKTTIRTGTANFVALSLAAEGATVRDLSVVGCTNSVWAEPCGVALTAGTLERCVIARNGQRAVKMTGGTMVNCLVRDSMTASASVAAGVEMTGGTMVNCTLADSTNTAAAAMSDLKMTGGTVKNTIARLATVSGGTESHNCFNEPVAFRNPAKGRYELTRGAANCIDRGDNSVWSGVIAPRDLLGKPRIFLDKAVDIGCCEYQAYGTVIILR